MGSKQKRPEPGGLVVGTEMLSDKMYRIRLIIFIHVVSKGEPRLLARTSRVRVPTKPVLGLSYNNDKIDYISHGSMWLVTTQGFINPNSCTREIMASASPILVVDLCRQRILVVEMKPGEYLR